MKKREEMSAAEKRAETTRVRKVLKNETGSEEGRTGAGEDFLDLVKRAIRKPKK